MIKAIELENFKIFHKQKFELSNITLITGINGIGKSSLIQSLLLLKQSFTIGYLQNRKKVDLSNDFINLELAEDVCYSMAGTNNRKITVLLVGNDERTYEWKIDAQNPKAKILDVEYNGSPEYTQLSLFSDEFIFLDAERWGPKEIYYKKEKRSYNTKLGVQGELTPAYITSAISSNEEIKIKELTHPSLKNTLELYENLNAWLSEILSLPVQTRLTEIDESQIRLTYNIEGSKGKSYSALQVGFGFTFCLPIIVAILSAKPGDLLIIENPEAHLHPSAQSKIGKLLSLAAALGIQIIVETHSEHVVNGVRLSVVNKTAQPENVLINFFSKEEGNVIVKKISINQDGDLSEWPKDFFDQAEQDFIELLRLKSKG